MNIDKLLTCPNCGIVDGNINKDFLKRRIKPKFAEDDNLPFDRAFNIVVTAICPECEAVWKLPL